MYRLQCNICGAKSIGVETLPPSNKEGEAIVEFQREHFINCASSDSIVYPNGVVSPETLKYKAVGSFGSDKRPLKSILKPHGHVEMTGPYGEQQTGDTLSCCHCRKHWIVRVGSEKVRGFCRNCMGYTCGNIHCDVCVPYEQKLECYSGLS